VHLVILCYAGIALQLNPDTSYESFIGYLSKNKGLLK